MPSVETVALIEDAVLWEMSSFDSDGDPIVADPVAIKVRWELQVQSADEAEDGTISRPATVFVDREVLPDSILWIGALADLPAQPTKLWKVVSYDLVPDLKGRNFRRVLQVKRWQKSLPTIAS